MGLIEDLPSSLSRDELHELIYDMQHGSTTAHDELIKANLKFVKYIVAKYFSNTPYDVEDLFSIGTIGLIKAVETYDISKNVEFISYAYVCISNEINMFFRRNTKYHKNETLDTIHIEKEDQEISIFDLIPSDINIEEDYIKKEQIKTLSEAIEKLNEDDRKIIILYYGLFGSRSYNQKELTSVFNITQSMISRRLKKAINRLRIQLESTKPTEEKAKRKEFSRKINKNGQNNVLKD